MNINRIHRLGHLTFSGYAQYVQKVEKNKDKLYNRVRKIESLPKYCGIKVNIVV